MSANTVRVSGGPAIVTVLLNRPQSLNAFTLEMLEELDGVLAKVQADPCTRVVVLTGAGRAFSAGVDLKALANSAPTGGSVGVLNDPARSITDRLASMPQIVIAKVNGACFTGALEIALACDLIVAAEEAVFGDTHARWGMRPTWGLSQRLPQFVGMARARELSYTARIFSGSDAAAWGLAAQAVPIDRLDLATDALAAAIAANSPETLVAYKDLYRAAQSLGMTEGLAYEAATTYEITDTHARLDAFVRSRQAPQSRPKP